MQEKQLLGSLVPISPNSFVIEVNTAVKSFYRIFTVIWRRWQQRRDCVKFIFSLILLLTALEINMNLMFLYSYRAQTTVRICIEICITQVI